MILFLQPYFDLMKRNRFDAYSYLRSFNKTQGDFETTEEHNQYLTDIEDLGETPRSDVRRPNSQPAYVPLPSLSLCFDLRR